MQIAVERNLGPSPIWLRLFHPPPHRPQHTQHIISTPTYFNDAALYHGVDKPAVAVGESIEVQKYSPKKWFLANAVGNGSFYGEGRIDVLVPDGKPWDICIWAKGFEPLLIRNVTSPADLGTLKLAGPNTELEELPHTIK